MSAFVLVLGVWNLLLSVFSLRGGGRRSDTEAAPPSSKPLPSVTLFVPCCGAEEGLDDNLRALAVQDYPSLSIVYTVSEEGDGAVPSIRRVIERHGGELVVAGIATGRGQKVHNLLRAMEAAPVSDVWAFADSDGRPDPSWLRSLVAPLGGDGIGAASTYRFYVPEPPTVASRLRSVWNQSVLSLLGDHDRNFAWGGGMAIEREVFDAAGVREAWDGALSDDYALTHAVRSTGRIVAFVPEAVVPSYGSVGALEMLKWIGRQMSITRVYWPGLFWLAAAHHAQFTAFLLLGPWAAGLPGAMLWLAVQGTSIVSAALRGRRAAWSSLLEGRRWSSACLVPVASVLTLQGAVRALVSRRIEWRGRVYEMRSPNETIVLR